MAKAKIIWRVSPIETGPYRSFRQRDWPDASYGEFGPYCASISCRDEYIPANVRTGNHAPLTLRFADHSVQPWRKMKVTKQFDTLAEAKAWLAEFLKRRPELRGDY